MAVPPFLDKPSQLSYRHIFFSSKTSEIPPFLSILNKSNIPFMKGGGMVGGSNYDWACTSWSFTYFIHRISCIILFYYQVSISRFEL